jgi:hypothetical protein
MQGDVLDAQSRNESIDAFNACRLSTNDSEDSTLPRFLPWTMASSLPVGAVWQSLDLQTQLIGVLMNPASHVTSLTTLNTHRTPHGNDC